MHLKFGFGGYNLYQGLGTLDDVCSVISYGESLGFEFVQTSDHSWDPLIVAAICAQKTSRIRLWPGAVNPFTRHPIVLANAFSLLDEIAPMRIDIILGTGNILDVLPQLGLDHRRSYDRIKEEIIILRKAFSSTDVDFVGKYFKAKGRKLTRPAKHRIRIYVTANGPRMLEVASEFADGVITQYGDKKFLTRALEHVKEGVERSGRRLDELDIVWDGALVPDREDVAHLEDVLISRSIHTALLCPPKWLADLKGIDMKDYDILRREYAGGVHYDAKLEKEFVEKNRGSYGLSELVKTFEITGDSSECKTRIEEMSSAGVKGFLAWLPYRDPPKRAKFLKGLATKILDSFR